MRIVTTVLALLLFAVPLSGTSAIAQSTMAQKQADELDKLFAQLRDPNAGSLVAPIDVKIWALWLHQGTELENQQLEAATNAMGRGEFPQALEQLNQLVAVAPLYPEAWNKRATLLFMLGRYDESLADIVKTLDLEPRHFGALSGRGMIYQKQGKIADALAAFKEVLVINPNSVSAKLSVQQLEKLSPEL